MLQDSSREKKGKKRTLFSLHYPYYPYFLSHRSNPKLRAKVIHQCYSYRHGGGDETGLKDEMKRDPFFFFFFLAIETYLTSIYGIYRHGASYPDGEFSKRTPGETSKLPIKK